MYSPPLKDGFTHKVHQIIPAILFILWGNGVDKLRYISSEATPWPLVSFERVALTKMVKN
jgi:hypothetical protein